MSINTSSNNPNLLKNNQTVNQSDTLSDAEITQLVEKRLEYLKWLIRYSKANNLKLVPSPKWLNTFACWLDEEAEKMALKYIKWEINFTDIPKNICIPKKFYYDLKMMLKSDIKALWALSDHELWHAEFTDYFDLFWVAKQSTELGLSVSQVALFFNACNEDPFIWRQVSKKWPARKNMVEHLYKTISASMTSWEIDISHISKLEQLSNKIAYHWLNTDFPKTYSLKLIVSDDVETLFQNEILPNFDRMISPEIPNLERVIFKNSILLPIIEKLAKEDLEERMLKEKLKEMMEKRQNLEPEQPKESEKAENWEWQESEGWESKPWERQKPETWSWEWQKNENAEFTQEEIDKAKEELKKMSDEELQELTKKTINKIDNDNLEDLKKEIPGLDWTQNENWELEFKAKENSLEDEKKAKEIWKKLEDAIKNHEEEIDESKKLEKEISKSDDKKDLQKLQQDINKLKSKKLKEPLSQKVNQKRQAIEQQEQRNLQNMIEQWFNLWEEEYYKRFIKLETQIEPYVEDFIKSLTEYIPKLKEYLLEWNYYSGTVYDIPKAWRKILMWHYDIYGRQDEIETMKINLWISLSFDVSSSMDWEKIQESLKLLVFLWIFCQKLGIPFYVNTIWVRPKEIKWVLTDYTNIKWDIMRASMNLEGATNMTWTFKQVREVQIEQKYHNPEIEFLPIIITDWEPSDKWDNLLKTIDEFDWLDLVFWLSLDNDEKRELLKNFRSGKKIFLDDSTQILTKWMSELIDYLISNKDRIFKIQD